MTQKPKYWIPLTLAVISAALVGFSLVIKILVAAGVLK